MRAWRFRSVRGSLARDTRAMSPAAKAEGSQWSCDTASATSARISSLDAVREATASRVMRRF